MVLSGDGGMLYEHSTNTIPFVLGEHAKTIDLKPFYWALLNDHNTKDIAPFINRAEVSAALLFVIL